MPLVNKQPFKPNPIPDNLHPDDEVFYHELTNEIFTSHGAFFDRFIYCNSLIWTCSRTGKSNLTYKEALESEQSSGTAKRKKKGKRAAPTDETCPATETTESNAASTDANTTTTSNGDGTDQPAKKKKKKYPYDPKKYSMPVPEGFDPSLLTPTGKIDGRKLKSKKNKDLAQELLLSSNYEPKILTTPGKRGKKRKTPEDEARKREEESRKKEQEAKRKAQMQAELAKERELEAKRKKEAATLVKQLERQKREEEKKKAAAALANWEKKCEDLERDDLRRLPQPTPVNCELPEKLFGDSVYIMEAVYNFHDLYSFNQIYPEGMSFDTLEEILLDKHEEGALGVLIAFLLKVIIETQPTKDGYGLDDDSTRSQQPDNTEHTSAKQESKLNPVKTENADQDGDQECESNGIGSEADDDENEDKDVNMNDLIGSAIRAAQEVKKSFSKPLSEIEITHANVTEILRLHLLQSGSFPKGRTIYNGWYSSREDPGLWLCMQEPDLIKKLGEVTVYDLEIEERIKILHTLIYQLLTFIKTRLYMEVASDQLTELRKQYRREAADFTKWDRENCVKRMQTPKRKSDPSASATLQTERLSSNMNELDNSNERELNHNQSSNQVNDVDEDMIHQNGGTKCQQSSSSEHNQPKGCLKSNGTGSTNAHLGNNDDNENVKTKKKISFKPSLEGAIGEENGLGGTDHGDCEDPASETYGDERIRSASNEDGSEQSPEELERAYQQNTVDYEDYQRERTIRLEQLNETLLNIRTQLRSNQSVYAIHPIGRDRAYRRYWLFQSLPGLFVELDDEYVGKCLSEPTPLESRYKKMFGKENPLMHPNESDLIRTKTCDVGCSTETVGATGSTIIQEQQRQQEKIKKEPHQDDAGESNENVDEQQVHNSNNMVKMENSSKLNGSETNDGDHHDASGNQSPPLNPTADPSASIITDEMNYCTGNETTCYVHGLKRPSQPKWWFYHQSDSIDKLVEGLNKRGIRESELHDVLSAESSIIKPRVAECPAYKLNKQILEQSGIRRSRRLRTKSGKRRARNYE